MSTRQVRSYDKEFKLNAIRLHLRNGRGFQQTADELGIPCGTLVGWVDEYKSLFKIFYRLCMLIGNKNCLKKIFMRKRYPSDISREQFKKIEPLLT